MSKTYLAEISTEDPDEELEYYLFKAPRKKVATGLANKFIEINPGLVSLKRVYSLNPVIDFSELRPEDQHLHPHPYGDIKKAGFRRFPFNL